MKTPEKEFITILTKTLAKLDKLAGREDWDQQLESGIYWSFRSFRGDASSRLAAAQTRMKRHDK